MTASRKLGIVISLIILIFSACSNTVSTDSGTRTPRPNAENTSVPKTPAPAASSLKVDRDALRGAQVNVWYPWFASEASLFESQIAKFNKENEWGIVVNAQSKSSYAELFAQTTEALKTKSNPQVVIAFPEHAFGWDESVVDLSPY